MGLEFTLSTWEFQQTVGLTQYQLIDCTICHSGANQGGYGDGMESVILVPNTKMFVRNVPGSYASIASLAQIASGTVQEQIKSAIASCTELLRYLYRRITLLPCDDQTEETLFLTLWGIALACSRRKVSRNEALVQELQEMRLAQFRSDGALAVWLAENPAYQKHRKNVFAAGQGAPTLVDGAEEEAGDIVDPLVQARALARAWFARKRDNGRYKGYLRSKGEKEIVMIQNRILSRQQQKATLFEVLFGEQGADNTTSVNLFGRGGSGKTFQILKCIERIFGELPEVIPFYIPLSGLDWGTTGENLLLRYLAREIGAGTIEVARQMLEVGGHRIVLFADGLSEIGDPSVRRRVAMYICEIRQNYRVRVLVSSRRDHTGLFHSLGYGEDTFFIRAQTLPLDSRQIDQYFAQVQCKVRYADVPPRTRRLLQTPQGCVMYAELAGSTLTPMAEIDSLGRLLEYYCNSLLGTSGKGAGVGYETWLRQIGFQMVLADCFEISGAEMIRQIGAAGAASLQDEQAPTQAIFMADEWGNYTFSHQNYRDYYCARYMAEQIGGITAQTMEAVLGEVLSVNRVTTDREMLELVAAFLSSGTPIQTAIDLLRDKQRTQTQAEWDTHTFWLSTLIRLYACAHGNCLAGLQLGGRI